MSSTHLITRVAFELELRNRQRAPLLQNRVSSFVAARMNSILIDSLSFAPSAAQPLVAANVELDLGEISFARLEDDLAAGIARRLREWALHIKVHEHVALHELSSGSLPQDRVHPFPDETRKPSSAGRVSATTGDLGKAVAGALHKPEEWPQLAQAVRNNHGFRRRLAAEVSPQLLDRLVKALFPECAAWTAELSSALISLHGITPVVPADPATFRRTLWECLLTVLARESKTVATQAFAAKLVQLLAARHSLQPGVLASRITATFNHLSRGSLNSGTHPASLKELNASLAKLNGASLPNVVERSPLASATLPGLEPVPVGASESAIEKLAGFLQWGVWPELDVHDAAHGPQTEMLRLLASSPDEICALLRRIGEMQVVRKRIARQFSEKVLRRVMFGFDPVNTSWMIEFMTELRRLHAQQPLVALGNRQFGELLWELALEYLSEHGWNAKNKISFLRFLLQRLVLSHPGMYQLLLADLSIRRNAEPRRRNAAAASAPRTLMNAALIFLLENDVLGIQSRPAHLQRLTVQRGFRHLYSDLDVLAYWLRWRKLPAWSFASTPEQLAGHIGPLLHELPAEVRARGEKHDHQSCGSGEDMVGARSNKTPPTAVQIEHWLLYGLWPTAVETPRSAALTNWLESRSLSDWLVALRRCDAQQHAVQRLTSQLSPKFLLRITSVLAGSHAEAICDYVRAAQALGARLTIACSPPWTVHVSRYTLAHLLKLALSPSLKELASATLPALSLACQVSYERLLLSFRQETLGQQTLQNLCDELDTEFDRCAVNRSLIPSGSQPFGLTPGTLARVRVLSESASDSEPGRDSRLPSSSGKAESFAASAASGSPMAGVRVRLMASTEYMESEGASSTKKVNPGDSVAALAQRRFESVEDARFSQADGYKAAASSEVVHGIGADKSPRVDVSGDGDGLCSAARTETSSRIAAPLLLNEKLGLDPDAKTFHSQDYDATTIPALPTQAKHADVGRSGHLVPEKNTQSAGTSQKTELSLGAPLSAMAERKSELSNSYKASAKYEALPRTSADKAPRVDVSEVSDGSRTTTQSESTASISELTMPPSKKLSLNREAKFSHAQDSNPTAIPFLSPQGINADAGRSDDALSRTTGDKDSIVDGSETSRRSQIGARPEHSFRISEPMMPPDEELGLAPETKFPLHNNSTTLSTRTEQHSNGENARAERVASKNHNQSEGARDTANSTSLIDVSVAPIERLHSLRKGYSEPDHRKSETTTHVERHAGNADSDRIPITAFENSVESDGSSLSKRLNPGTAASPASQEQLKSLHESQLLEQSYPFTASRTVASSGKNKADEAQREQLEHLEHLLRTGNLPQWSDALTAPARAWVGNLLHSEPAVLMSMLRSVAGSAQSIARLVRYVPKPGLSEIVASGAPEFGGLFILYIETGASLGSETRLSSAQRCSAAGVHWRETLGLILDQNTPIDTPARSLRALCSRVAQQLGLAADQYLETMTQAAAQRAATESKYAALAHVLSQVKGASPSTRWNLVSNAKTSVGGGSTPQNSDEIPASPQSTLNGDLSPEPPTALPKPEVSEEIRAAKELDFPHDESDSGQLEYLLRYGELPPAAATHRLAEFMENVVEPLIAHPELCRDQMRRAASSDLERKRMARLFSARALKLLWPLLLPSRHAHAALALEDMCAAATACARGVRSERVREICIEVLLSTAAASAGHRWDVAALFRSAIERLAKEQSLRSIELIEQLRRRFYCRTTEIQESFGPALDRVERETAVILIPVRASGAISIPGSRALPRARHPKPLPSGEPFYIGNAGAILLWPFLSRYFESLGLLEQGSFRGEKERSRAVYLVQYLASGTLEAPEHELLLNKILCGIQPEQPLETVTPLTETEEVLSAQLLHSLILNWEKLRNTSIDGLRQSFLLRDGRLLRRQSDGAWSLTVSTRAYDMLLDTLPWRLSMVRLPWMLTVLHVKWR